MGQEMQAINYFSQARFFKGSQQTRLGFYFQLHEQD
jgi:hypothetical protein